MSDPDRAPKTLTLSFVRHVTAPGRYYDQDGLILTVSPSGGKSWTQRLTIQGRRRDIGLGSAHVITPAQARTMAAKNKAIARVGGNPLAPRADRRVRADNPTRIVTFAAFSVTRYRRLRTAPGAEEQARESYQRVRLHANPLLGRLAISEITEDDVVRTLFSVAEASRSVARWLRQQLAPIFDEAMAEGLRSDNPVRSPAVTGLVNLEPVRVVKDAKGKKILDQLPDFLRRIEQDHRRPASFMLIRFCLLTARNPGECRLATWPQIDLERRLWRFPRMQKPGKPIVELALHEGHLEILDRVRSHGIGGMQGFIFPSRQGIDEPFDVASLSMSLKRAGYDIVLMNFQQAHKSWVSSEGGNEDDLCAWWERLRHPPTSTSAFSPG